MDALTGDRPWETTSGPLTEVAALSTVRQSPDAARPLRVGVPLGREADARTSSLAILDHLVNGSNVRTVDLIGPSWTVYRLPERDIPVYLQEGGLDLALCTRVAVEDSSSFLNILAEFDDPRELVMFAPQDGAQKCDHLVSRRVATPFPHLVRRALADRRIRTDCVIALDPADNAVALGVADAVAVLTDPTRPLPGPLQDMRRIGVLRPCPMVLVDGCGLPENGVEKAKHRLVQRLCRLQNAGAWRLVQYDCRSAVVELTLTDTGAARPDVVRLDVPQWSRVRVRLEAGVVDSYVERLVGFGCRNVAILRAEMVALEGELDSAGTPSGGGFLDDLLPDQRLATERSAPVRAEVRPDGSSRRYMALEGSGRRSL